jgi:hypothetical protein
MVKFSGVAAIAFLFASCHNDVPELPALGSLKYCEYMNAEGWQCKSTYEISETDCEEVVGGSIFCDTDCKKKEPCESEDE